MTQLLKDFLANKKIEYRSVQKALVEQRNDLVTEMEQLLQKPKKKLVLSLMKKAAVLKN
jgi:hypothetical protein